MVRACNVANAAAGKVAKFLALYEGPYKIKKRIARTNNDGAGVGVDERKKGKGKG